MTAPADLAAFIAANVVLRAGSDVKDREPTWNIFVFPRISISSSFSVICVSAPGFLANEKVRSPSGDRSTNASVVKYLSSRIKPLVSICSFSKISFKNRPCISVPAFPRNAVFAPKRAADVNAFAGAPPGFCANSFCPFLLIP